MNMGSRRLGEVLNGLYAAQKAHTLSKVVDLPSPDYPANYNALLQFVQNLYLEDLASINSYFLRGYHPELDNYPLFKKAYEESVALSPSNKGERLFIISYNLKYVLCPVLTN